MDVEWGRELSAFDFMMFRADGDARTRSSVMWAETLDVVPAWDRLCTELERASRVVLRLRQKVVAPLLPVTAPRWVTDPDFDLANHVRRIDLPEPSGFRAVLDTAAAFHSEPMELERPLWEVALITGMDEPGEQGALAWKLSHAVTDGVGGVVLDLMIRSEDRDLDRGPLPPKPPAERSSPRSS